ncbi:MAG TPA: sigma-70 family RNA polymerase sigma factor [Kofleriaceae bacterium]|nr:sigma-70 family RNA polymerase sigma factor [Kofleriaceae bacterium]
MSLSRKPRPLAVVADPPDRGDRGDRAVGGDRGDRGGPGVSAAPLAEQALAYVDDLYGLARHLCPTQSDAEDIVQETFARALGGVARLAPGSNLRAWLFRILRNCFIDQARRKKIVLEISDDTVGDRSANEVWDAQSLDQLRYLAASDLERALATLPHELRIIVLLDAQGFSEAEIAEIARCAQGTVKSRLSRARARLRGVLRGGAPGEGGST